MRNPLPKYEKLVELLEAELAEIPKDKKLRILEIGPSTEDFKSLIALKKHFGDRDIEWSGITRDVVLKKDREKHQNEGIDVRFGAVDHKSAIKSMGEFDFIISKNVFSWLGLMTTFIPSAKRRKLIDKDMGDTLGYLQREFDEVFPIISRDMHQNVYDGLKPGGKAIHVVDPQEDFIKPRDVPFHVKSEGRSHIVVEKRKK
ncbi:MAG: hypothetical protein KAW41_00095 [Candidatus Diapherotrites archaeon]|nr:hypothetical protein [Candidatus Diapherotrites archaeon]